MDTDMRGRLKDPKMAFAGHAIVTLLNTETGKRFTYSIKEPENDWGDPKLFIGVLNGPDNTGHYAYLGYVTKDLKRYVHKKNPRIREDAQSVQVIKWFIQQVHKGNRLPNQVEVWHEGRCCRCGRKLTVPESIEIGLGPHCAAQLY